VPEILVGAPYRGDASGADAGRLVVFSLESDCDGDGLGPFGGDCNDADGGLWRAPSEVVNLAVAASPVIVTWEPPADPGHAAGVLLYDTLRASSPDGLSNALCLEISGADLSTPDDEVPPPGTAMFYLVRACNLCGPGSPGRDSAGDLRSVPVCP